MTTNSKTNILLIEDNLADAEIIEEILLQQRNFPFSFHHSSSLQEGIDFIKENNLSIILLDLDLPDSSGLSTLAETRNCCDLPIVIMTGNIDERIALEALERGAQDYLIKGQILVFDQLKRVIQYAIHRKEAEEQLLNSEKFLSATLDGLSSNIAILNAEGQIVHQNKAWIDFFSSKFNDLQVYNDNFLQFCQRLPKCKGIWPSSGDFINGINKVLYKKEQLFELDFKTKDDERTVWLHGKVTPLQHLEMDKVVLSIEDITQNKIMHNKLARSEKKHRDILNNINIGVALINRSMLVLEMNEKMKEWFPNFDDKIRGKCDDVFCYKPNSIHICDECPTKVTLETGERQVVLRESQVDETEKIFRIVTSPLKNHKNEIVAAVQLLEDITDSINMERKLQRAQKMEAIGSLAGGIAHDFNNILTSILGYSDFVKEALPENSDSLEDIEEVITAANRATELVNQILTFSRQTKPKKEIISLQAIIHEVLRLLRSAMSTSISIEVDMPEKDLLVYANPSQLHQVFMNICTNASQAIGDRVGKLSITLTEDLGAMQTVINEEYRPDDNYVKISIVDTGPGMKKQVLDKIFDPFYTTKEHGQGTGLGLSVVHGIIKELSGDILAKSVVDQGSQFDVYLPLFNGTKTEHQKRVDEHPLSGNNRKILLIDDEPSLTSLIKKILVKNDYIVTAFNNSKEAVNCFRFNPDSFDFVISDMNMPDYTGLDIASIIKEIRPTIPFVLMSGNSSRINKDEAVGIGIEKVLTKPFTSIDLLSYLYECSDPPGNKTPVASNSEERKSKRIFIVDDDPFLLKLNKKRFEASGYIIKDFSNSLEALKTIEEEPDKVDLLITDQTMPKLLGVDLAQRVRNANRSLPIIICTGHQDFLDMRELQSLGIAKLIHKPILANELLEAAAHIFNNPQ